MHSRLEAIIKNYGGEVPNPYTYDDLLEALEKLLDSKTKAASQV